MANVAHAGLTGSNLHEPKGIAAAPANQLYVSNGAGSGVWQQAPAAAITPTAIAFSSALFHARERQNTGINGNSPMTGSVFSQRTLNIALTNDLAFTFASNQVTLPIGTYFAQGYCVGNMTTFNGTGVMKVKLFNVTALTDLVIGSSAWFENLVAASSTTSGVNLVSQLNGRFTIGAPSVVEMRAWQTGGVNGGLAVGATATDEIYAELMVWKVG